MRPNLSLSAGAITLLTLLTMPAVTQTMATELSSASKATGASQTSPPRLQVQVDPRIELVSLLFRLAGNAEYLQGKIGPYNADIENQFGSFHEHSAVVFARTLREKQSVSYDACMGLAILLTGISEPRLQAPLKPWPDFLDRRWTPESASNFVTLAGRFVKDTQFEEFIKSHQELYRLSETRMQELMDKEAHLDWFSTFFGERPQATFRLVLGMLNGGSCYGPHWRDASGHEELFCILGVWATDSQGAPVFNRSVIGTVVHEFCHSYANPIIEHHRGDLQAAGQRLYGPVAEQMRSQAYGNGRTLLCESLVRASVVRYLQHYEGTNAAQREIRSQKGYGFLWMQELSDLLGEYESQRERYSTLESFSPRLVAFFKDYSKDFAAKQSALDAKRPKVVSMEPANHSTGVSPELMTIQVVFDRPMRDGGWAMCGGGPHFPELVGKPHYDALHTTWSVGVKLKPNWDYEFSLNAGQYQSFQSEDGIPLTPVPVQFKTAPR